MNPSNYKALILPTQEELQVVKIRKITHLTAERNYTWFYLNDSEKLFICKTLQSFESVLTDGKLPFFRTHASHIVNYHFIKRYLRGDGGEIVLLDGTRIPVARRRKEAFLEWLKAY